MQQQDHGSSCDLAEDGQYAAWADGATRLQRGHWEGGYGWPHRVVHAAVHGTAGGEELCAVVYGVAREVVDALAEDLTSWG